MTTGERIRSIRLSQDLTQEFFGERIGLKKNSVSQIESGKSNPSDQTIRSICREFGVSKDWLRRSAAHRMYYYLPSSKNMRLIDFLKILQPPLIDTHIACIIEPSKAREKNLKSKQKLKED